MRRVDKSSPLPIYYQLKEILLEMIENEDLKPGDATPPERELCAVHGISRMTARKAIMELVREGYLYREQGRGTFVAKPKPQHQLNVLRGFTEEMEQKGLPVRTKILSFEQSKAPRSLAKRLQIAEDEPVLSVERLRYVDGQPFALERVWLNGSRFGDLTRQDLEGASLYQLLRTKYQVSPHCAVQTIEPIQINQYESQLFSLPLHSLALLFCRTTYSDKDEVLEYTKCIYRADLHKYEILLKG